MIEQEDALGQSQTHRSSAAPIDVVDGRSPWLDTSTQTFAHPLLMVVAAFCVGMGLRLLFLGSKGFWLDEVLSIHLAADPNALFGGGFDHSHPPLYYALLHDWLPLGMSEFSLRLSSALLGSLAILISYALALELAGRRVAFTTMWLVALSPLLVWYSQELRSYSLLTLLGLLATLALSHVIARPKLWWWLLFVIAMSAALYTHYAAILLTAIQIALIVLLYLQGRATRNGVLLWLAAWPLIVLLYWPWLTSPGMAAFAGLMRSSNLYPIEMMALRFSIPPLWAAVILALLLLFVAAIVLATFVYYFGPKRRGKGQRIDWQQWLASPLVRYGVLILFVALTVVSVIPRLYTVKKLTVALWPYGLLAVAWVFPWRAGNRLPLILLLTLSLIGSLVNVTVIPKDQWREMASYLQVHGEPTDIIWVSPDYQEVPLSYYFEHGAGGGTEASGGFTIATVAPTMSDDELAALVDKGQRVWLIYHAVDFRLSDPDRRLETWLQGHLAPIDQAHFYRIEATLYGPPP